MDTRAGDTWWFREILAGGNGYLGQNELTVHVGLGDATTVDEVVASWPGGQTTRILTNLPSDNLWTLYPPERLGDFDGDGTIDLTDFAHFLECVSGAVQGTLEPGCEMMDFDGDGDVDLPDFGGFEAVFTGPGG